MARLLTYYVTGPSVTVDLTLSRCHIEENFSTTPRFPSVKNLHLPSGVAPPRDLLPHAATPRPPPVHHLALHLPLSPTSASPGSPGRNFFPYRCSFFLIKMPCWGQTFRILNLFFFFFFSLVIALYLTLKFYAPSWVSVPDPRML